MGSILKLILCYWLVYNVHGKETLNGECFEKEQSPINIKRSSTIYTKSLAEHPLKLKGFGSEVQGDFHVENNGHTVTITISDKSKTISGGSLGNHVYRLLQFHFHWGGDDEVGSEHTIDMKRFPLEMHLVFLRNDISNFSSAHNIDNGLTVLAVLFEVGTIENLDYKILMDKVKGVEFKYDTHKMTSINIGSLLPNHDHTESDLDNYFTYAGSLTTPPCSEVVVWNVLTRTVKITSKQLESFRNLKTHQKDNGNKHTIITQNYRPLQDLNGREVQRSFEPYGFAIQNKKCINLAEKLNITLANVLFYIIFILIVL